MLNQKLYVIVFIETFYLQFCSKFKILSINLNTTLKLSILQLFFIMNFGRTTWQHRFDEFKILLVKIASYLIQQLNAFQKLLPVSQKMESNNTYLISYSHVDYAG